MGDHLSKENMLLTPKKLRLMTLKSANGEFRKSNHCYQDSFRDLYSLLDDEATYQSAQLRIMKSRHPLEHPDVVKADKRLKTLKATFFEGTGEEWREDLFMKRRL